MNNNNQNNNAPGANNNNNNNNNVVCPGGTGTFNSAPLPSLFLACRVLSAHNPSLLYDTILYLYQSRVSQKEACQGMEGGRRVSMRCWVHCSSPDAK